MYQRRTLWVVGTGALLVAISMAHVLEDFVYSVPARFGLETAPAAAVVGLAYGLHVVLIAIAARDQALGYFGNAAVGAFWLVAAAADHLGEVLFANPYRAGLVSKAFEVGLMLAAPSLVIVSLLAWRSRRAATRGHSP